jgi:hypothetical protein
MDAKNILDGVSSPRGLVVATLTTSVDEMKAQVYKVYKVTTNAG